METIMSKFILSTLVALTVLSGASSASIAAPQESGNRTISEEIDNAFPANFWDELHRKAAG
jgi:hypothetical protein